MTTETNEETLLERAVRQFLRAAAQLDSVRLQAWENLGLTLAQLRILFLVRAHPGADVRRIAERLSITPSAVSQQVDKLVIRGYLLRRDNPDDRRHVALEVTAEGDQAATEVSRLARERVRQLLSPLSDSDLVALEQVLAKLWEEPRW